MIPSPPKNRTVSAAKAVQITISFGALREIGGGTIAAAVLKALYSVVCLGQREPGPSSPRSL
jgi:hypothetical protein